MKNFIFLSLFVLSTTASAKSVFSGVNTKLGKCYSRQYSTEHMAKNPKQTVTAMAAKFYTETFSGSGDEDYQIDLLKIQAKVKGSDKVYGVELACNKDGSCFIDCDGPRVAARFSKNNPGSMLIDNSEGSLVLDPLTCGDDVSEEELEAMNVWLKGTKGGDDIFRLDPMPDYQCL